MKSYRLSLQAEQTLENIFAWTIDHFGLDQAVTYKNKLIIRLASLALDEQPHGRSCNRLLADKRKVVDLEYYREESHYIIYRNTTDGIFVLDFVHGFRDLDAVLDELCAQELPAPD